MIRAVLFDMDGVLVDSEPAHFAVSQDTLRAFNLPLPDELTWNTVFFGRPDRDGLRDWFTLHDIDADIEAVMADKVARFEAAFTELVTPFEDGQWLARELHRHGLPLALVTGARRVEAELVLSRFDLHDIFSATITSDESIIGKPDPKPYLMGADALGVPASDCVVIEDAVPGLRAAEAAGATAIVVDRLNQPQQFAPLTPVSSLDGQVLASILDWAGITAR